MIMHEELKKLFIIHR